MVYYAAHFFYLEISQNLEMWKTILVAHTFGHSAFTVSKISNKVFIILFFGIF